MKYISDVVKDFEFQFRFLVEGAIEKTVINDEAIFPFLICQITNVMIDDICYKKRSKMEPVCFCRIKEKIKSIL